MVETAAAGSTALQLVTKCSLDQLANRFGARGPRLRLAFDPRGDLCFELVGPADGAYRVPAGPRAAAGSFFSFGY